MTTEDVIKGFFETVDQKCLVRHKEDRKHYKNLNLFWGKSLCCFEELADRLADTIISYFPNVKEEATLEFAITCILGKVILRFNEISVLLWKGYPDGAMALARSLHEQTICLLFIIKHRDNANLINRYFDYPIIEKYKNLLNLKEIYTQEKDEFKNEKELSKLQSLRDGLYKKYGNTFGRNFGWSFCIPEIKGYADMEKDVSVLNSRVYYIIGNRIIHSNPEGNRYSLGHRDINDNAMQMGPSIYGMKTPADYSLSSILQVIIGMSKYLEDSDFDFFAKSSQRIILKISIYLKEAKETLDKYNN